MDHCIKNLFLRGIAIGLVLMVAVVFVCPEGSWAAVKKPGKVKSLKVTKTTYNSVKLKWKKASRAKKYIVYRSTKQKSGFKKVATVKKTTYTDKNLQTKKKYWYVVRAVGKKHKKGKKSSKVSAVPTLKKPTIKVSGYYEGIQVTVGTVKGATGYKVTKDGKYLTDKTSFLDEDTKIGESHEYNVVALRKQGGKTVKSEVSKTKKASRQEIWVKLSGANNVTTPHYEGYSFSLKGSVVSSTFIQKVEVGVKKLETVTDETTEPADTAGTDAAAADQTAAAGDAAVTEGTTAAGETAAADEPAETIEVWAADTVHYTKKKAKVREFSLSGAPDNAVKFGTLPAGTYYYTIIVTLQNKPKEEIVLKKQRFEVIPEPEPVYPSTVTQGAKNAIKWAKEIANDDSFAYGTGSRSHHGGCYFCGTNVTGVKKAAKGSKWEKTYCCNPFIFAAYAHGAKDPAILKACKKGKSGGMEPKDWTQYGCFATVGKCKNVAYSKLLPGDVILSNKTQSGQWHHVIMYIGDNRYVEAGWEGWGSNTIGIRSDMKTTYKNHFQKYNTCYVMRYTGK
ncbi:MAG: C40 family peptidase [Firmicutes bacterium]|nr:C40 family peptidase [Bacillota bacterium]